MSFRLPNARFRCVIISGRARNCTPSLTNKVVFCRKGEYIVRTRQRCRAESDQARIPVSRLPVNLSGASRRKREKPRDCQSYRGRVDPRFEEAEAEGQASPLDPLEVEPQQIPHHAARRAPYHTVQRRMAVPAFSIRTSGFILFNIFARRNCYR